MYIRGLIPRNFAELAEAVPIVILRAKSFLHYLPMGGLTILGESNCPNGIDNIRENNQLDNAKCANDSKNGWYDKDSLTL